MSIRFEKQGNNYRLSTQLHLPLKREKVFDFFSRAENLARITPPRMNFRIVSPLPITMETGTLIDYRVKVRGFPLKWRSEITLWDPPLRFVDEQRVGPYKFWRHEHRFEEHEAGTLIIDTVEYGLYIDFGLHSLLIKPDLSEIFEFREKAVAEHFQQG